MLEQVKKYEMVGIGLSIELSVYSIDFSGARITWVENSHTGDLIPIARRILNTDDRIQDQDLEDAEDADLEHGIDSDDEHSHLISPPPPLDSSAADKSNLMMSGAGGSAEDDIVATISSYNNIVVLQRGIFLFFQVSIC